MKNICIVLGTRPEAIKLAPLIVELKKSSRYKVLVCNTEQQKELSNQTLKYFGVVADMSLDCMRENQQLFDTHIRLLEALNKILNEQKIDAIIVQGDTLTAYCGAISAFFRKIPVFHVEAGLRSYNLSEPYPEELLRQVISRIATLHFCPTNRSRDNLLQESISSKKIYVTGNTVIDALFSLKSKEIALAEKKLEDMGICLQANNVLVTVHRRENHGSKLINIVNAIYALAKQHKDFSFVLPVHPNPNVHDVIYDKLGGEYNIKLLPPLDYPVIVTLLKEGVRLVITDSGGLQEEAPTFGIPVLIIREKTERTEGVESGCAELIGTNENDIIRIADSYIRNISRGKRLSGRRNPYGNGNSSSIIVSCIDEYFEYKGKN